MRVCSRVCWIALFNLCDFVCVRLSVCVCVCVQV